MTRRARAWLGVAVAAVTCAAVAPPVMGAAFTSMGYVQLRRNGGAAAAPYFARAVRWAPWNERAVIGQALAASSTGDDKVAARLLLQVPHDSVVAATRLLPVLERADLHDDFLRVYSSTGEPALRRAHRDAAAAAAVRKGQLDDADRVWPGNLCAALARFARDADPAAARALADARFDGAYSRDAWYRQCLQQLVPAAMANDDTVRATLQQTVVEPAALSGDPFLGNGVTVPVARPPAPPLADLRAGRLDLPLEGEWRLQAAAIEPVSAALGEARVWLRVTGGSSAPMAGAVQDGDGWIVSVGGRNLLENGTFELGAGAGPYVPWGFSRVGNHVPGFTLVRRSGSRVVQFARREASSELRQRIAPVRPGHVLLFAGSVRLDEPGDPNRGVTVYAYWSAARGQREGFTPVLSGLSAHPDARTFTAVAVVPLLARAMEIAYATTATAPAELDDAWVIDVTDAFAAARTAGRR